MDRSLTIKICGLSTEVAALAACRQGATSLGFVLAPSRRRVTIAEIGAIRRQLIGPVPDIVAIVVNETEATIERLFDDDVVDAVQLAGDEHPDLLGIHRGRFWKAMRFPSGTSLDFARAEVDRWLDHAHPVERILVDGAVIGSYGGTGHTADWDLAAKLAEIYPITLAGGLTAENVDIAIAHVRPTGVDVSSGVESNGIKDVAKIAMFVQRARDAFAQL